MPRSIKLKDAGGNTVKRIWVSLTQDCGHEVFQINFKHFDQSDFHTYTCFCETCGVRTNIQLRQTFESIRSSLDTALQRDRQEEQRRYEEECNANYATMRYKANDCLNLARSTNDWNAAREQFKSVQNDLKSRKLKREQRDELWQAMNQAFSILKERQDDHWRRYEQECNDNYRSLSYQVNDCLGVARSTTEWKDGWIRINAAKSHLKGKKLRKEQSSELWDTVNRAADILKERQNSFYREKEEKQRQYEIECDRNYSDLRYYVRECEQLAAYTTDWREARNKFAETRERLKGKTLKKDQRNALYEGLHQASERLNSRYEDVCAQNRRQVASVVDMASYMVTGTNYAAHYEPFKSAKDALSKARSAMAECKPLKKEDYEYFTNELNRAWGILKDNERLYFESRKKR